MLAAVVTLDALALGDAHQGDVTAGAAGWRGRCSVGSCCLPSFSLLHVTPLVD